MTDPDTIAVYDARAADYAARFAAVPPDLAPFAALLPEGARVLDLGCGPGHCAAWLAARGVEAHAWDASQAMVDLAAAHPGVRARLATFDDLDGVADWDGVWASFSLLHAPRAAFGGLLGAIARATRTGGAVHVAMKTGAGEARDGIGRRYSYVSEAEMRDHMERAGLRLRATRRGADAGLSGEVAPWCAMTAIKAQEVPA